MQGEVGSKAALYTRAASSLRYDGLPCFKKALRGPSSSDEATLTASMRVTVARIRA